MVAPKKRNARKPLRVVRKLFSNQLLLSLLIIAVAGAISWRIVGQTAHKVAYVPTSLSECQRASNKDYQCYAKYYSQLAYTQGPKAAFKDMEAAYNTDTYVKSQCHQLAHMVGRTAYEKTNDLVKAYAEGDSFCMSGYYHGAIEQAAQRVGADNIRKKANTLCKPLADKQRYSPDHFNCVHGLGHGLMAIENYNLFDALGACDALIDTWESSSCYGGVFMENVMLAIRGDGSTAYFHASEPLYPCTAVITKYKEQCYLIQTSYILAHNSFNFAQTSQDCAKADVGFDSICYQSLGRDALGSAFNDPAKTYAYCSDNISDQNAVYYCIYGAVRNYLSYYRDKDTANKICQAAGPEIASRCLPEVAAYNF
jgi:hypothetical protein